MIAKIEAYLSAHPYYTIIGTLAASYLASPSGTALKGLLASGAKTLGVCQ